jgi:hypothetical protein
MKRIGVKFTSHIMPWEIDHFNITCDKLRTSLYNIDRDIKIYVDVWLNLSGAIIDWEKSTIPKEYFTVRFKAIEYYFKDLCNTRFNIYNDSEIFGCLDAQRDSVQDDIDYYVAMCPDMNFNEYLMGHLLEAAKQITTKYFIITPQIFKCWDKTWDILVNDKFKMILYENCLMTNSNLIIKLTDDVKIQRLNTFKFSGWLDLYNKAFYEKLVPVLDSWHGYGPWDLYSMNVCVLAQRFGEDVQQYFLENQVVWFYDTGGLRNENEYGGTGKFKKVYDNFIQKMSLSSKLQREDFESDLDQKLKNWIIYYNTNLRNK